MDGPFYVDTRAPHINADIAAVTVTVQGGTLPIMGVG